MKEIVKYHNDMNFVKLNEFKQIELDLFFAICQQMRDKNLSEIELDFAKIRELTQYTSRDNNRLYLDLRKTYKKLLQTTMAIENQEKTVYVEFVLFTKFKVDKNNQTVTIRTNKEFKYVLNAVTSNFTRFELEEFVNLKKTTSKTTYRLLKQFRKSGIFTIEYDDFLNHLGIQNWASPDTTKEINRIVKDLKPFFKNLRLEKVKKGNKATGKIERLIFHFEGENTRKLIERKRVQMSKYGYRLTDKIENVDQDYEHPNQAKLPL